MTRYLLAGGGTAGHVNPLLAIGDRLRRDEADAHIVVLGTVEGLESRLVPERGYELLTIPRLPFPRRPSAEALAFPRRFRRAVAQTVAYIDEHEIDVVVGVGGYAAAPAYSAARKAGIPFAIHEANAIAGLANRLGARSTRHVGITFPGTRLPHATLVGMPLRPEIEELDRAARRDDAATYFGLDPEKPTVLVTGGSLGARRINETIAASVEQILASGFQVLHVQGGRKELSDPGLAGYRLIDYCNRMDFALALADFAVGRAGAGTVSEQTALGIPAVYVPLPIGNGEQQRNAASVVAAGGALLVLDAAFTPGWVREQLVPILSSTERRAAMTRAVESVGIRSGTDNMIALIRRALTEQPLRARRPQRRDVR